MQGRNAQVARIYRILNLLEGAPQGLTASEIRSRLIERGHEVSRRTVYRDLEALSEAGFPLFPSEEGGEESVARWVLERSARIGQYLALSSQELFALYLARGLLVPLRDTPLHSDLERVFRKIEEKLGTVHREHFEELSAEIRFEEGPSWSVGLDAEVLETVRAACAEGQVLSVDYESANSGTVTRRRLGPHYVYFAKGSVYLIAEELAKGQTKVFALPRMRNPVMEDQAYDGKPVDHETFFASSFGVFHGKKPEDVKIRFAKSVASFVKERRWHQSQRLVALKDGSVELSMTVAVTPELVQWILGFGADARVLASEALRDEVAQAIGKMSTMYAVG